MINLNAGVCLTDDIVNNINNTYTTIQETNTIVEDNSTNITGLNDEIDREFHHDSLIFPETSDGTWILTASAIANTFGAWEQIIDSKLATLQGRGISGYRMHISAIVPEDASVKDKIYIIDLAYGVAKTGITRTRYMAGNIKAGAISATKVRSEHIPYGQQLFARVKCETGAATCQLSLRFHLGQE